jgi:hypothetical protein
LWSLPGRPAGAPVTQGFQEFFGEQVSSISRS